MFPRIMMNRVRKSTARLAAKLLAVSALAALTLSSAMWSQNSAPAKATEDLPRDTMQAKATTACTECHEARIILQQRLSKAAWTKEVDKMIKWGAVVDASDHDALVDYFSKYFSPDQPPHEAPRTAAEKGSAGKTAK
jgi:hypothetical protein